MSQLVYLLTVDAVDESDDPQTLRFASGDYRADANNWPPRLITPVLFAGGVRMPWLGIGGGQNVGVAELANSDGRLDYLADWSFNGRDLTCQTYDGSTLMTIFRGTVSRVEVTKRTVKFILRDRANFLNDPYPQDTYLGDGTTDLEGRSDIAGVPKPKVLGSVSNATPVLVDYAKQIYQVSSLADCDITAARDRGVELTDAGSYASENDLLTGGAPASGSYKTWEGFVRLGVQPQALTVDAEQADNTADDVLDLVVTGAGATLDAPTLSQEVGIYLRDKRSTADLLNELVASVAGMWWYNASDEVEVKTLAVGTASHTIPQHRVLEITRQSGGSGSNGLPVYRVVHRFDRVETVQTDVAITAPLPDRWANAYREDASEDSTIKTRHLLSEELVVDTARRTSGSFASDLVTLLKVRRDQTSVRTRLDLYGDVELGDTVTIEHERFGYSSGRDMVVISRQPDAVGNTITFGLWG